MKHDLLNKRLIFITGKGGTGKTTLVSAIATVAKSRGRRVLVVETDLTRSAYRDLADKLINIKSGVKGGSIEVRNVQFIDALKMYLVDSISVEFMANVILKNKSVRSFLEATPFAKELVFLNAFYHFYHESHRAQTHDLIIIDLPSTGHAIPILSVSDGLVRLLRRGPMVKAAIRLKEFVSDHQNVSLGLVTVPEELPISETLDTYAALKKSVPVTISAIFLNRVSNVRLTEDQAQHLKSFLADTTIRSELDYRMLEKVGVSLLSSERYTSEQISRLTSAVSVPTIEVQEAGSTSPEVVVQRIAEYLGTVI